MQAINQQSRRERLAAYRRNPFSLFLAALVTLSAVITLGSADFSDYLYFI